MHVSFQNLLSRIPRISSTRTPSICKFLLVCSNNHESVLSSQKIGWEITTNGSINPATCSEISIADKMYDTIMSTCSTDQSMERALDDLGVKLTTELVNDVIHKLRYEEKRAFRFFTWAGHQNGYNHEDKHFNDMIEILSSTRFKMKQFGVTCDVLDYMKRHRKNSVSVEALLTILKTYTENHLIGVGKLTKKKRIKPKGQPEVPSLNLFLDSLCKCSLVVEAEAIFRRVKRKVVPTAETYNILFFGWCRVRDPKNAMKVLEEMIERGHDPENFTYTAAITSFCDAGMIKEARKLFEFMRTKGSTISSPTAHSYSIMIIALAKYDMMDECFNLLSDMRGCGCLPDVSTYIDLIEGMCLAGKVDASYKVLEEMSKNSYPPDILTYNCFLKVLCNMKNHEEAMRLCDKMIESGCEPSVHTYNMLIKMFYDIGDSNKGFGIWLEMDKRGCTRTVDTYSIMIDGLFSCGKAEDACVLLEEVMDRGMKLPYKKFDILMSRLSEIGNLHAIHRLSEHMRRFYNVAMSRRFAMTQKKRSTRLRRP